ncbi:MAG: hypothetical protein PHW04_01115 [Candidatus Wallbacteria bacterium]|nr:hypothetical protein [Candidatus Wallbacteria bacterium]
MSNLDEKDLSDILDHFEEKIKDEASEPDSPKFELNEEEFENLGSGEFSAELKNKIPAEQKPAEGGLQEVDFSNLSAGDMGFEQTEAAAAEVASVPEPAQEIDLPVLEEIVSENVRPEDAKVSENTEPGEATELGLSADDFTAPSPPLTEALSGSQPQPVAKLEKLETLFDKFTFPEEEKKPAEPIVDLTLSIEDIKPSTSELEEKMLDNLGESNIFDEPEESKLENLSVSSVFDKPEEKKLEDLSVSSVFDRPDEMMLVEAGAESHDKPEDLKLEDMTASNVFTVSAELQPVIEPPAITDVEKEAELEKLNKFFQEEKDEDISAEKIPVLNLDQIANELPLTPPLDKDLSDDVLSEISAAFDTEVPKKVPEIQKPEMESSTYSAFAQNLDLPVKSIEKAFGGDEAPEEEEVKESPRVQAAKKVLSKLKDGTKKSVISGQRKRGFSDRLIMYLMILSQLAVFLYFGMMFIKNLPGNFVLIPVVMLGIFLIQFLAAIRQSWLPTSFYMLSVFNLCFLFWRVFWKTDLEKLQAFWTGFQQSRLLFLMIGLCMVWLPLALTEINKKARYFLTIVGFYGLVSFIHILKYDQPLEGLVNARAFEQITQYFCNPFFILVNVYIPICLLILLPYTLVSLFRRNLQNFFRSLIGIQLGLFLFLNGNLFYHNNFYPTPLSFLLAPKAPSEGSDLKTLFLGQKPDTQELADYFKTLNGYLTGEVSVRKGGLSVIKAFKKELPQGSTFFPQTESFIYLQDGKVCLKDDKGGVQILVKESDPILSFGIYSAREGHKIIYAVKKGDKSLIYDYDISRSSKNKIEELDGAVLSISAGRNGRNFICQSDSTYLYSGGKFEQLRSGGRDYFFSRINDNDCFYSCWDETNHSNSLWKMDIVKQQPELLVFDNKDKTFPTQSSDGSYLAFLKQGQGPEIWVSSSEGNGKGLMFKGFEAKERVKAISWNYNGTGMLISTDKSAYLLQLNVVKEKSVPGTMDERSRRLSDELTALGFREITLKQGRELSVSVQIPKSSLLQSVAKLEMAVFTFLPEFRDKTILLALHQFQQSSRLDLELSGTPIFRQVDLGQWREDINWR